MVKRTAIGKRLRFFFTMFSTSAISHSIDFYNNAKTFNTQKLVFEIGWQLNKTSHYNTSCLWCLNHNLYQATEYQQWSTLIFNCKPCKYLHKTQKFDREFVLFPKSQKLVHVNLILVVPAYMSFDNKDLPQYT